jgi:plasmid maintenance system antidote protein VapI
VSRQALHAILTERASVTPEMPLRLGKLCGNGPEMWVACKPGATLNGWAATRRPKSRRFQLCRRQ